MTDKPKSTFARRVRAARPRARKYEISDDAILGLTHSLPNSRMARCHFGAGQAPGGETWGSRRRSSQSRCF